MTCYRSSCCFSPPSFSCIWNVICLNKESQHAQYLVYLPICILTGQSKPKLAISCWYITATVSCISLYSRGFNLMVSNGVLVQGSRSYYWSNWSHLQANYHRMMVSVFNWNINALATDILKTKESTLHLFTLSILYLFLQYPA